MIENRQELMAEVTKFYRDLCDSIPLANVAPQQRSYATQCWLAGSPIDWKPLSAWVRAVVGARLDAVACQHKNTFSIDPELNGGNVFRCKDCSSEFTLLTR